MTAEGQPGNPANRGKIREPVVRVVVVLAVVAAIVLLGSMQIRDKCQIVKNLDYVGPTDDVAYAIMGASIRHGEGINVNYVSDFYHPYPRDITHRENHWPPFMSYSIAPMFWLFGQTAYAARLPAIFYGSIGLPLATALLTYALSRRGYAAIAAALLIMATTPLYQHSLRTLSDVSLAMLIAGFCGSVILARKHPWMHVLAGLCLAGAYYAKGSQIVLLGFYPMLALFVCGWRVLWRKWFLAGIAIAVILMAPFWYANWRDFGSPFFTTQNYVTSFYGFDDWETAYLHPYWGKSLPTISDRWKKHPKDYWPVSRSQIATAVQYLVAGGDETPSGEVWNDFGPWGDKTRQLLSGEQQSRDEHGHPVKPAASWRPISRWISPVWTFATLLAVAVMVGAVAYLPVFLALKLRRWWRGRKRPAGDPAVDQAKPADSTPAANVAQERDRGGWLLGAVLGLALMIVFNVLFLAFFWKVGARFLFPMMPLLLALACTALVWILEWPVIGAGRVAHWFMTRQKPSPLWVEKVAATRRWWPATATFLAAMVVLCCPGRVYAEQRVVLERTGFHKTYPFSVDIQFQVLGRWVGEHLPNAIVMCRKPCDTQFYMSPTNKSVRLPAPSDHGHQGAGQIFAIARYYGVTHMAIDQSFPALQDYTSHRRPGFKRLDDAPLGLYELDWTVLPKETVEDVFGK